MKSLMAIMLLDSEIQKGNVDHVIARRCAVLLEGDLDRREVEKEVQSLFQIFNQIIAGSYLEQIKILKLRDYVAMCIVRYMDAMKSDPFSHESFIDTLGSYYDRAN